MSEKKDRELKIKQMLPLQDKALVYIIRRQSMAKLIKVVLECNGTYIATTKGKSFVYLILDPGSYTFISKARNIDSLQLNVEATKTYFILQKISTGGIMTITQLKLIDENTGRKKLKKCSLIETESSEEMIPASFEYTQESLTPPPPTSKEKTKFCLIALLFIIAGIIILLSGIFDIMNLWG